VNEVNMNIRSIPWVEPAHPSIIRIYEDLVAVYGAMKERQVQVDKAFDEVAAEIGFVVTTTIPVNVKIEQQGSVKSTELDKALGGTMFEKAFAGMVREFAGGAFGKASPGSYRFYLIWYDALALKLRRDWVEPAHVLQTLASAIARPGLTASEIGAVIPECCEPAQWFDPSITLAVEDVLSISAISQVYPELRLAERVSADRMLIRQIRPHVMEPVHFSPYVREPAHFLQSMVRPEVREPAHFR
jgi:hypothetical protein